MIAYTPPVHFDLRTIMDSGQCFRIFEPEHNVFDVLATDMWVRVYYNEKMGVYFFDCSELEFADWQRYFDLYTDYQPFFDAIEASDDAFLKDAAAYGNGMRILRQSYWESLVSFIISQNNNIPRIKKTIEAFCKKFGDPLEGYGLTYYGFPGYTTMKNIKLEDLSDLGLGYRAQYIYNVCTCNFDLLAHPTYKNLLTITGIGPKVASCIMLFGRHDLTQCPIDTWMKKILHAVYNDNFDFTPYHGFEGFIQQLMFYYYRHLKARD